MSVIFESKKERDKIRHIIHCQFEKIPTRNGRPLYLTDESKSRKTCLCCGDDYSNILPTGIYPSSFTIDSDLGIVIVVTPNTASR